MSANIALIGGAPGFFTPRFPAPWLYPPGTIAATSAYDTSSLKATLEELIGRVDPSDLRSRLAELQRETAAVRRSFEETVGARSDGELAGFDGAR